MDINTLIREVNDGNLCEVWTAYAIHIAQLMGIEITVGEDGKLYINN